MRIPSQFNEDSLYRRGRRRDDSAQTYRRLIRLVIGLALVLVIMRQASRPQIYQTFFGPQATQSAVSTVSTSATPAAGRPFDPQDREIAHRLTAAIPTGEQKDWVVALSRWQSGHPIDAIPPTSTKVLQHIESIDAISDPKRQAWLSTLHSFLQGTRTGDQAPDSETPPAATAIDQVHVAAFLVALDEAAASRVVDGSVWRAGDFDAFYRYLDQADSLSATDVAFVGVLPLLQQPDVFRNQAVRVHGGVARAERLDAKDNPFGITHYWQLWLRPSDGADRPIVAIVRAVPPDVESVGADATVEEGPQVSIVGTYLKRWAYQSSIGADLAPVIVGRISSKTALQPAAAPTTAVAPAPASNRLWVIVVAASLAGIALAVVTMWRTSVMSKRARELRAAHRKAPADFLKRLEESDERGVTSG